MVPDLSRSCWRKMVCKRHRRGGEGQVLPQPSSPNPRGVPRSPASCGSCSRGSGTPPAPGGRCRPSGSTGSRRNWGAEGWRSRAGTGRAKRADPGLFRREEAFQPGHAQLFFPPSPLRPAAQAKSELASPRESSMLKPAVVPLTRKFGYTLSAGSTQHGAVCARGKNRLACKRDATGHGWGRARSRFLEPVAPRSHPWSTLGAATRTPSPFPQPPSPGTAGQPSPSSHGEVSQAPGCLPGKLSPARGAKRIHPSG